MQSYLTRFFRCITFALMTTLALLTVHESAKAQDKAFHIDRLMAYCHEQGIFNGTIAIAQDGKAIYVKAFGFADFTTETRLDTDYAFYLASVSKQFTTMAIMMLKERGQLTYDDPLSKYFSGLPDYAHEITIRHLMTHTSGIPDHFRLGSYKPDLTNEDVLALLTQRVKTLDFAPGSQYRYSNSGYVLLAMVTEMASGKPFHTFMHENIFAPLKMDFTLVYDKSKPKIAKRAVGFDQFKQKADYDLLTSGAGGMFTTVGDLLKWDRALSENRLVAAATLDEAYTPFQLSTGNQSNYGYGWGIRTATTGKIVSHSGSLAGYRTFLMRHLDDKYAIVLLTNKGTVPVNRIVTALTKILYNQPYDMPKIPIATKMQQLIDNVGVTAAIEQYAILKRDQEKGFIFHENELNALGYFLLQGDRVQDAIQIFKLNVDSYPEAANPYDSLGEAYMTDGQLDLAAENYRKSLELDPDNAGGKAMLRKIKTMLKGRSN